MKLCMTRVSQQGGQQLSRPMGCRARDHVVFIYVTQRCYTVTQFLWSLGPRCSLLKQLEEGPA